MGVYYSFFYGNQKDPSLLLNKPRLIRSDEWVVNTQMTVNQKSNHYERINKNIGEGQDMSVIVDAPYKEWSEVFRPHNWAFFVLPFEYAFAFKWWVMGYLLILSCYFFTLTMLPGKRLIASALGLAVFFTPFVQWWYQYITLGPLYYSFFVAGLFVLLLNQKRRRISWLLGILLGYLLACFALVLYPPFQIPCGLALVAFCFGFLLQYCTKTPRERWLPKIGILTVSLVIAASASLLFIETHSQVIHTIEHTAYPGVRLVESGGYDSAHLLSGNMDFQLLFSKYASHYQIIKENIANQSEASSFFYLWPFLLMPCFAILFMDYRARKFNDWPLLFVNLLFVVGLIWLFIPHLNLIGKLLFLNRVPHNRLIIGLGLLGFFQLILLMRRSDSLRKKLFSNKLVLVYCMLIFACEAMLDLHAKARFPGFMGNYKALAFALPAPVITYAFIRRYYDWAAVGLAAFCIFMSAGTNPLYRGTNLFTSTRLASAIAKTAAHDPDGKWVTEDGYLENFTSMSGAKSLSGVYAYPQQQLWRPIDRGKQDFIYNRYAHVSINLDRDGSHQIPDSLLFPAADHFGVRTEPCSNFLKISNVHFALTEVPLTSSDNSCIRLLSTIPYPARTFYIYRLD